MCIVKDERLHHQHDDHPHVLIELVHLLREDRLVDA